MVLPKAIDVNREAGPHGPASFTLTLVNLPL
jgi:hypothetical protein